MDLSVKPKRVAFVLPHLGPGGAQRVAATAANALSELGIETHVITILDDHADFYSFDTRVLRHRKGGSQSGANSENLAAPTYETFNAERPVRRFFRTFARQSMLRRPLGAVAFAVNLSEKARWLRRLIQSLGPDAVLSFLTQTNIITIAATRGLGIRTIVSERNDPRLQQHRRRVVALRKLTYPWADVVTANTYGALSTMGSFIPKKNLAFLPNPIKSHGLSASASFAQPTFIAVTRLVEQKGIDVLLKAAAIAFNKVPYWQLAIMGDGTLRHELQALANKLGIATRVKWYGQVDNPIPYLKAADAFILTSRFEGSPNALLEAMACGLPPIVSDASPGPLELVGNEAGLIVPTEDVNATAEAIVALASDDKLRKRLGAAALERTRMHELDNAMQIWRELLRV